MSLLTGINIEKHVICTSLLNKMSVNKRRIKRVFFPSKKPEFLHTKKSSSINLKTTAKKAFNFSFVPVADEHRTVKMDFHKRLKELEKNAYNYKEALARINRSQTEVDEVRKTFSEDNKRLFSDHQVGR
jgi:hypothetical protein